MFHLAQEWGKVEKVLPKVTMLPGERHGERVLSSEEEELSSQRRSRWFETWIPFFSIADSDLRSASGFAGRTSGTANLEIHFGKSGAARRRIPMTLRVSALRDA